MQILTKNQGKTLGWQAALRQMITDPNELLTLLELDKALFLKPALDASKIFPLKVTRSYVERMQRGNPHDPLLLQALPLGLELRTVKNYTADPLHENAYNPVPGLLHKYLGRVLVTLTGACAINCRFCFRRHFPYADNNAGRSGWEKIFAYIAQDETIDEVILSGGDPLMMSDSMLQAFTDRLQLLPQVNRLRIHTRLPVILPERVTSAFIAWLAGLNMQPIMVIHCNHAQEIDHTVKKALNALRGTRTTLLNQTVLLKGVNDQAQMLINLSKTLFTAGVLPYYLHVLDKVQGAAHFDLPLAKIHMLYKELLQALPGYLVPRLVREEAGAAAKTLLSMDA